MTEISPAEAADRLALRELFGRVHALRRPPRRRRAKALFTADTRFAVYMDGEGRDPTSPI